MKQTSIHGVTLETDLRKLDDDTMITLWRTVVRNWNAAEVEKLLRKETAADGPMTEHIVRLGAIMTERDLFSSMSY